MLGTGLFLSIVAAVAAAPSLPRDLSTRAPSGAPVVHTKNGSYYGIHDANYNEDYFLGMPFAAPPIGGLRFRNPASLNSTWSGMRPATGYAFECIGYGGDQLGYQQDEDCLYLNVVRPSGCEDEVLPVAVWIHGGGLYQGGTPDRRYNLSFIVENSVKIGKPIMAVSIPYRLGPWGFLNGNQVMAEGQTNIGLKDQRLALHWIKENIAAFGGDPSKVTIWGESAGAASVGFHITAFNGRQDNLFRAGIMESGNPVSYQTLNGTDFYEPRYQQVVQGAGCAGASDTLECLRQVPFTVLNNVLNTTELNTHWFATVDGDFVARYGSQQLKDGHFVKVPVIDGANSDEGVSFSPNGINTTADFEHYLNTTTSSQIGLPPKIVQQLLQAYPSLNTSAGCAAGIPSLQTIGNDSCHLPQPYGYEYRQSAAYFGDEVFIANRRLTCQTWSKHGIPAYCYRFNAIPAGVGWPAGVPHFQEVAFVFNNLQGLGYGVDPFLNKPQSFDDLSTLMSKSWASFVNDLDPNGWQGRPANVAAWPKYDYKNPMNIVWDANVTSHTEPDTFRAAGMKILNDNMALLRR